MAMEWQKRASCDGLPIDEFYALSARERYALAASEGDAS